MTKYEEIAASIKQKIANGDYKANDQLPFEKDLCDKFNASKMTVKKALDLLVAEGLIVKRRGAGTFVKDISQDDIVDLSIQNQFAGLSAIMRGHNIESEVLDFKIINSDKKISENLKIDEEDFVCFIHRVRYVDGKAIVIEKTYMPLYLFPSIKRVDVEGSIYSYIEEKLKYKIQSCHSTARASKSDDLDRKYLKLESDEPVLEIERVGYLDNGKVFEYSFSRHRYDSHEFKAIIIK
ncbi:GntR family transcriptional regulator [Clostridium sp. AL.422]|uniref:GntR family transcriptional regulator n=1 Tax=Clostridium TaxID=1485 RepID=UPI00293DCBD3|nr:MULTISPECIES: GntR family transcriptional regulator [unclassified Clostridium]MDV4150708.1 GntR family transcriptional regulator [Clostridium sp. AL.422]